MNCKTIQVFQETDLRNGHDGLARVADKANIKLGELRKNELVIFINRKRTALKVYANNDVLAYYRSPGGRLEMQAIQHIPAAFGGGSVNYDSALKKTLESLLN